MKKFLIILLITLVFSCQFNKSFVEKLDVNSRALPTLTINEAQEYYNTVLLKKSQLRIGVDSTAQSIKINPDWQKAETVQVLDGYSIVEAPVQFDKRLITSTKSTTLTTGNSADQGLEVYSKLVFSKSASGRITGLLVHFAFEEAYAKRVKEKRYSNKFAKIQGDFSGYQLITNLKGDFLYGFVYQNGKLVNRTFPVQRTGVINSKQARVGVDGGSSCGATSWYWVVCNGNGQCDWTYLYTTYEEADCPNDGGGSGSGPSPDLNSCEWALFIAKPFLIPGTAAAKEESTEMTEDLFCNQSDGTDGNAFKHAYWNALMAQYNGPTFALEASDAHECGDTSTSSTMDWLNNRVGVNYANSNDLVCDLLKAIKRGEMWKLGSNGQLTPTTLAGICHVPVGCNVLSI